ncbi:MAG: hypothetical protein F6K19_14370 [Cyanothece sp. SIO1E1]|nr:hypothetical protein [Cyanothece sp. SIO1E1]
MVDRVVTEGLKLWLIFLIVFFLLGYPVLMGIGFGAIGGLAGGWVMAQWTTRQLPLSSKPDAGKSPLKGFRGRLQQWRVNSALKQRLKSSLFRPLRPRRGRSFRSRR